ncbi:MULTISPECIES: tRNA lysidine(34) synthetase TilS [unclassified Novosphingobium]|uniref:tRNA lysidine(34) synthetase TilS n=1 Tax=unclassified Novosphingobium TaxID=2644732 RepID=UPI0025F21525|nr:MULTISPECIES: tRNA lysidine(34) synthetase TilS [unclassified Novosphingobium]HQS71567.1 tRNA lysidine(34) synthetase TilS [Novosphingobium sp.]
MGLAVSGGSDSLALLLLFHEVAPRNFCVATVDHGLRAEAAAEAAMVAALCGRLGVAHHTLSLSLAKGSAVQERARTARYAALGQWCTDHGLAALVAAHHADDQAETMVMRLNRGAGLRGLAGMRSCAPVPGMADLPLLRPLLDWRRAELAQVVQAAGLAAADDPSNRDTAFERVRVRAAMTATDAFDAKGFAASAQHLAAADQALDWAVDRLWQDVEEHEDRITWNPPHGLPPVLALRILERILTAYGRNDSRGADLSRWLDTLQAGGVATLGNVKGDARRAPWRFTIAPKRRH